MNKLSELLIDSEEKQPNFITQYCKPLRILGKGAFSTVVEIQNLMTNKKGALKIIEKSHFNVLSIGNVKEGGSVVKSIESLEYLQELRLYDCFGVIVEQRNQKQIIYNDGSHHRSYIGNNFNRTNQKIRQYTTL
ncbi:unnamed protein product (macronuclear) [Paramecium tetraurelia]|uniref:Protein kinase domain-containing protein n=1 Tax=Paramecium tetraurelia TaxID=5888 RepID=A0CRX8_PARTE|nr:uncharacterized protein GSPATT00038895001 [Paramecium tetraurelia]CAK73545.1 unnamed protein product [Paramecium tetraurelia]|eukprot:XP_001440942.1 hypothetical protein (macronuclear) [Paramecium tetraurelia strain d4-2]